MKPFIKKVLRKTALSVTLVLSGIWAVIAYNAWKAAPLKLWHTYVPQEMAIAAMNSANWQTYIAHENKIFEDVRNKVALRLPKEDKTILNRYHEASLVYPPRLAHDWNRSYILHPKETPKGAVVLLHGLTDTPYSLRHVADFYTQKGFIAFGIRLPGHGTVPAALTKVGWKDWEGAVRLAVREAVATSGMNKPLHIVGFSNGGALAVKYAMDVLEDSSLPRPDRLVLISPMIGVTRFARFAGIAAVP